MDERTVVSIHGMRLHSAYNPQKEAERFVQSLELPFAPAAVVITEPALSYALPFLTARFPGVPVYAVRYSDAFAPYDAGFTAVFPARGDVPLSERLFSQLGEETLSATLFCAWKPSQKAFPEEDALAWEEIRRAVLKSRDVLATREYFSLRWAKNALRFCLLTGRTVLPQPTHAPVLVCASGPSLRTSLSRIRQNRSRLILVAVSSALSPLLSGGITPDLIVSTDGGYWAKPHLFPCAGLSDVPVALPAEAACPAAVLASVPVVPLSYGDGMSETILRETGIPCLHAERNGTVSGTAARLALSLTDSAVFFCGLDLAPSAKGAHCPPNQNDIRNSMTESRLCTRETRLTPSLFPSPALSLYASWFSVQDFKGRLFRLSDGWAYANSFGSMPDVGWEYVEATCTKEAGQLRFVSQDRKTEGCGRRKELLTVLHRHADDPAWKKDALPALSVRAERSLTEEERTERRHDTDVRMRSFIADAARAIGGTPA